MTKRLALGFLTAASLAILAAFFVELPAFVFAALVMAFPVALVTLAVSRDGQLGRLRAPLAVLFVMLQGGVLGVLALTGSGRTGSWGMPLSLHLLLLLVWLGPLVVTTVSYAAMFSELGIDDELLGELERRRRG
jgi:hypothetical protein